jgi:hypothetical protein
MVRASSFLFVKEYADESGGGKAGVGAADQVTLAKDRSMKGATEISHAACPIDLA